jgi:hypothetical protein
MYCDFGVSRVIALVHDADEFYGPDRMEMIPQSGIEFIQSMHRYWQNETQIFVQINRQPPASGS